MGREVTRSQRDWLECEVAVWQAMGLVDEERAKALLGLYQSRESLVARQQSRGLFTLLSRPFGAGVVYLLSWAVLRYVDLFGVFGRMLGASLMFFLCGGSLMAVALYWRKRKAVSLG